MHSVYNTFLFEPNINSPLPYTPNALKSTPNSMSQACVKISQNRINDLLTHATLDTLNVLLTLSCRKRVEERFALDGISRGIGYSTLGFFVALALLLGISTALTALIAPFLH